MFWATKKKEDDREKQLKHLKAAFPSMRRPNNDDRLFELRFTVDNQYNTLRITVPDDFPQSRPVYQVLGPVVHHWLDGSKLISGCRKLNDWNPKTSSILEITEDILAALLATKGKAAAADTSSSNNATNPSTLQHQHQPPPAQSYPLSTYPANNPPSYGQKPPSNPNLQSYNTMPPTPQHMTVQQPLPQQNASNQSNIPNNNTGSPVVPLPNPTALQREDSLNNPMQMALPDIPSHFPELDKLTEVQLERLLKDSVALEAHIASMDSVQAMESLRDMQRETNAQTVSKNLLLGEEVNKMRHEAESLQDKIRSLHSELQHLAQEVHKEDTAAREKLLNELKKAVSTLDEESDAIGEGLIRGSVDVPTFKREYLDKRSKYYTLACRLEIAASLASNNNNSVNNTSNTGSYGYSMAAGVMYR